jgi:hypothetical protein
MVFPETLAPYTFRLPQGAWPVAQDKTIFLASPYALRPMPCAFIRKTILSKMEYRLV